MRDIPATFLDPTSHTLRLWIRDWLAQKLNRSGESLRMDQAFREQGISCGTLVSMAAEMDRQFRLGITPTEVFDYPTVNHMVEGLCGHRASVAGAPPGISTLEPQEAAIPPAESPLASESTSHAAVGGRRQNTAERVAVVGMACRMPGGCDTPKKFWDFLLSGKDGITAVPDNRWPVDAYYDPDPAAPGKMNTRFGGFINNAERFDAGFFGISPREAESMDPQQRLALEVAWEALEQAAIPPGSLEGSATGVFMGVGESEYGPFSRNQSQELDFYSATGSLQALTANRISYVLGLRGPSICMDMACSSSLLSVHMARQSILQGECDLALAGGCNLLLSPSLSIALSKGRLMSPDGRCKTFDAGANGYVRSEGVGIIVLKRLSDALRDGNPIWGVLAAGVTNHDGYSNGLTVPNGAAQRELLETALRQAGLSPEDVSYLETHGTGTRLGDPVEFNASLDVLGKNRTEENPLIMGALKSSIGHLERAAGIAACIKVLLALNKERIPPNLHFQTPNPLLRLEGERVLIPTEPVAWKSNGKLRRAGISSFGVGGTNVHIIVEEPPVHRLSVSQGEVPGAAAFTEDVLLLSAKNPESLQRAAGNLAEHLEADPNISWHEVCRTLQTGRTHFAHRFCLPASGTSEACAQLKAFQAGTPTSAYLSPPTGAGKNPAVCFAFSGQGAQYAGMSAVLARYSTVFKSALDECADSLDGLLDRPLHDLIHTETEEASALLDYTEYTQPSLFAVEYALSKMFRSWGIAPRGVLGHSVGEFAAMCAADGLSLEEGLRLVVMRGKSIRAVPEGGGMRVFFAPPDVLCEFLKECADTVIAAFNGPENTVVAGPIPALSHLADRLEKRGIRSVPLPVSHAFHSPLLADALPTFRFACDVARLRVPNLPLYSNVTGAVETTAPATAEYWCEHLMRPVRFAEAVTAAAQSTDIFLEIGPHPVLCAMGPACTPPDGPAWVPTLRKGVDDRTAVLHAAARLHAHGVDIAWRALPSRGDGFLPLPTYAFEPETYWHAPLSAEPAPAPNGIPATEAGATCFAREAAEPGKVHNDESSVPFPDDAVAAVAAAVAVILRLPEGRLPDLDVPLIRQGFDSLMSVQLKNILDLRFRRSVPLPEFLRNPTITGIAERYTAAPTDTADPEVIREEKAVTLAHVEEDRFRPFILTDIQHAYWVGRKEGMALGGNGCQVYLEVDASDLDVGRLEQAVNILIRRHDMLRMVVDEDGMQRILPSVPAFVLREEDLRPLSTDARQERLAVVRAAMSSGALDAENGPLYELRAARLDSGVSRLFLRIDMLAVDGRSMMILAEELIAFYLHPEQTPPHLAATFRDYVIFRADGNETATHAQARRYWRERLESLPAGPMLPTNKIPPGKTRFIRHQGCLQAKQWAKLRSFAASENLTPSSVLLAAFGTVLSAWSSEPSFSLNLTLFDRPSEHPELQNVVGDFTTLILLVMNVDTRTTFVDFARTVQERVWEDMQHSRVSAVEVLREMRHAGKAGSIDIAPVVFTSLLPLSALSEDGSAFSTPPGLDLQVAYSLSQTPQVWLDHQVYEHKNDLLFNWDVVEGLFPADMIEDMLESYTSLLHTLAESQADWKCPPRAPMSRRHAVATQCLSPTPEAKPDALLHEDFEKTAAERPDALALVTTSRSFRYRELDRAANGLAHMLQRYGATPGKPVGILMPKGWEQIIAVTAVLKAGACFLPLDAELPAARLAELIAAAGADILLVRPGFDTSSILTGSTRNDTAAFLSLVQVIPVTGAESEESAPPLEAENTGERGTRLAYIIYTSGSTGLPKGVVQDHGSVVNTVRDINERFGISARDVFLGLSNLSFDLSVYDIFGALSAGACLCLPEAELRKDPAHWLDCITTHRVTVWNSAPALMQMLMLYLSDVDAQSISGPRLALLSGDWVPPALPKEITRRFPDAQVVSLGGATEAAIWSIHHPIVDPEATSHLDSVPYGTPLKNQTILPLDRALRPRPVWVPGTLHIGGVGLAVGYRNDPQRTAERFVVHPETGERLYDTGDFGRILPGGTIEFLGRKDFQVKVRGHRIELGEIETVLRGHPRVTDAVAGVLGDDASVRAGTAKRLFAHVLAKPEDIEAGLADALKEHLHAALPEYMIPGDILPLSTFPVTANGKVDRIALARLAAERAPQRERNTSPNRLLSPEEAQMVDVWREVLGIAHVGPDDDFFALGGDSLLGTRLVGLLRKRFGAELSLSRLFASPTVAAVAPVLRETLRAAEVEPAATVKSNEARRFEPFSPTPVQHAYWMGRTKAFELGNVAAHCYQEIDARDLDAERLARAWHKVVHRHDMLRATVRDNGDLIVARESEDGGFPILDLRGLAEVKRRESLLAVRAEMSRQTLDTSHAPLADIRLSLLPDGVTRIHLDIDNIIVDAWSLFLIMEEWANFYADENFSLPPLRLTFRDYTRTLESLRDSIEYHKAETYWQERLPSLPPAPELPTVMDASGIEKPEFRRLTHTLDAHFWEKLRSGAAARSLTPSAVLLTAYGCVLARWSRTPRFCINVTLFNRPPLHEEVEKVVGDFTSLNILETDFSGRVTFARRAASVQQRLAADLDNKLYSGVDVMRRFARLHEAAGKAVMPVVFTSALTGEAGRDASVLSRLGELAFGIFQTPQVWLDHQVYELNGRLVLNWDVVEGLFPDNMIEGMFEMYCALLHALSSGDEAWDRIGCALPADQEQRRLQAEATEAPLPKETLHGLFAKQAAIRPNAPAILTPSKSMTYEELDRASSTVARHLLALGVPAGSLVPIIMERGWEQVVAAFGVCKAGCAYLPVPLPVPSKRLGRLAADSGAVVLVTHDGRASEPDFPDGVAVLRLHEILSDDGAYGEMPLPEVSSDALAYVVYTSGSTGTPKGVAVTHLGAVNTILDINDRFNVTSTDRVLGVSSFGFDLSVYDIFGMAAAGGALVYPENDVAADPSLWLRSMRDNGVTIWNSAPQLLKMLLVHASSAGTPVPASLRLALLSGDWIPKDLPKEARDMLPGLWVVSLGGATEASIWSVLHEIAGDYPDVPSIPYGNAMKNQKMYVLNEAFEPCPEWVPGDLYIGGVGLAVGYWRDEEKTQAAFVVNPESGERLYRTGDRARRLPYGFLEFLGRADLQLKIRGHRVEPGEIEAFLTSFPHVREAVVVARDTGGSPGTADKHLHAFVVGDLSEENVKALKEMLRDELPVYMVPETVTRLESFPLTSNGKVDRSRLVPVGGHGHIPPTLSVQPTGNGRLEQLLTEALTTHLGSTSLDLDGNFFDLGATSFHLVQIQAHLLGKMGRNIPIREFFLHPTPRKLLAHLEQAEGAQEAQAPRKNRRHARVR